MSPAGEIIDDPRSNFTEAIYYGRKKESRYQPQFKRLYTELSNDKGEIAIDDLRIIGAVVTGDTASMRLLQAKNYVKAATLGIVIDRY